MMGNEELNIRIRDLEFELSILKSSKGEACLQNEILLALEKAVPYGVVVFDDKQKHVFVNKYFCDLIGWNKIELLEQSQPFLYWPTSEIENINSAFNQAFNNESLNKGFELVFCHKSGKLIPVQVNFSQLTIGNNRVFWSANILEISKRLCDEKSSIKTESHFKPTDETSHDLIFECDKFGNFTYLNTAWYHVLGYNANEMLNKPFSHFQSNEYSKRNLQGFENLLKQKELLNFETVCKHKNGQNVYLSFTVSFTFNDNNEISGIIATSRDSAKYKLDDNALIESEQKFVNLVEHSPNIIYTYSNLRGSLFWSKSVKRILGYHPDEIQENPFLWESSIHPDYKESVLNAIEDEEKGRNFSIEYRIKTKAGKWIWLHNTFMNKTIIGNEIIIEGFAIDITARKEAELALKESEAKLTALYNAIPDLMFVQDIDGVYLDYHAPFSENLYTSPEVFIGKTINDVLPIQIATEFNEIFKKAIQTKEMQFYEYSLPLCGGTKYFEGRIIAFQDNKVLSIIRDITANKQAEQALKESETKFKEIISQIKDGITVFDEQGTIIVWNKGAEKITGIRAVDAINENIVEIQYHLAASLLKNRTQIENSINNIITLQTPEVFNRIIDYEILMDSGEVKNIQNNVFPIQFKNFNLYCIMFRDNTEVKQYEKQLIQLNTDKDRFITILAHDLKNPFNGILGLSDLLVKNIKKYDHVKIENIAGIIHQTALQTYNLLEELLLWTRAQSGKLPFRPQKLQFGDICKDIVENLQMAANNKNITINHLETSELNVLADINMLKTILRNLVSNAIKFTNIGGKVDITTHKNHANVTITVSDNGIGMRPDTLSKLFDITQIVTTEGTASEKGTGIGLLLCKEFVEKHSGKIWAESDFGKRSEFKFTIPLYKETLNDSS